MYKVWKIGNYTSFGVACSEPVKQIAIGGGIKWWTFHDTYSCNIYVWLDVSFLHIWFARKWYRKSRYSNGKKGSQNN